MIRVDDYQQMLDIDKIEKNEKKTHDPCLKAGFPSIDICWQ